MKHLTAVVVALLCPLAASAQSVEGVWKAAEVVIAGGPNAGTISSEELQPSLAIFTRGHYATMGVVGRAPRPRLSESRSESELAAAYRSLRAAAGTYTLQGSTLTRRGVVSKNPNRMDVVTTRDVRLEGDMLWLTSNNPDGTVTTTVKYSRLEEPSSASPLEGAWRRVEMSIRGGSTTSPARGAARAGTYARTQPSLLIFTKGYYSLMEVRGNEPRDRLSGSPSNAELASAYQSVRANSGRYELDGSTLRWHIVVDQDPNRMGNAFTSQFRVEGDSLGITSENQDGTITTTRRYVRVRAGT